MSRDNARPSTHRDTGTSRCFVTLSVEDTSRSSQFMTKTITQSNTLWQTATSCKNRGVGQLCDIGFNTAIFRRFQIRAALLWSVPRQLLLLLPIIRMNEVHRSTLACLPLCTHGAGCLPGWSARSPDSPARFSRSLVVVQSPWLSSFIQVSLIKCPRTTSQHDTIRRVTKIFNAR